MCVLSCRSNYSHGRTTLLAIQVDAAVSTGKQFAVGLQCCRCFVQFELALGLSAAAALYSLNWHQRQAYCTSVPLHSYLSLLRHSPFHAVTVPPLQINSGNSGGPVLLGDHVVGIAFQCLTSGENIGYIIPVPVINHFLEDLERNGKYTGATRFLVRA